MLVPVHWSLLHLLYKGVMEEDHSLVMAADILRQMFHFQYSWSSMVCYTVSAGYF